MCDSAVEREVEPPWSRAPVPASGTKVTLPAVGAGQAPARHLSRAEVAWGDHAAALSIDRARVALEVGLPFGLQRHPEHLLGGHAAELVQSDLRPRPRFPLAFLMDYPQHPAYGFPATPVDSGRVRRLSLLAHPQLLAIPPETYQG